MVPHSSSCLVFVACTALEACSLHHSVTFNFSFQYYSFFPMLPHHISSIWLNSNALRHAICTSPVILLCCKLQGPIRLRFSSFCTILHQSTTSGLLRWWYDLAPKVRTSPQCILNSCQRCQIVLLLLII